MVAEPVLTPLQQEKALEEALNTAKAEAFAMKRCLDQTQLMDGLKHASIMLSELRTNQLSPKLYYRLYIDVTEQLQHLELYLFDAIQKGRKVADLYEIVQYAANIIPRLYLMITVGVVYIKSGEASKKDIIKDLVEMARGVQHPLRGLFLRNYLLQSTRNLLPNTVDEKGENLHDGSINDSIDFILLNFAEMNKLWVRMQYQGSSKDRDRREKERLELRILVGTNLVRMSQLENISLQMYKDSVLPAILEQVVSCRDAIAQEYLMDSVVQVFPDEFHLATLDIFLTACTELHQGVQMRNVVAALIDRLSSYASVAGSSEVAQIDLFSTFSGKVGEIVESRQDMPTDHAIALQISLVNLALECYPDRTDYVDKVFEATAKVLSKMHSTGIPYSSPVGRELMKLLRMPVENYNNVLKLLNLENYSKVINTFDYRGRTLSSTQVIQSILEQGTKIPDCDSVEKLFTMVSPLLNDQSGQPTDLQGDEDFAEEQSCLARVISLLQSDDVAEQYNMILVARQHLATGGKHRLKHSLPPIVFAAYQLIVRLKELHKSETSNIETNYAAMTKVCKFALKCIQSLQKDAELAESPLKLLLQGVLVIDQLPADFPQRETIAYEFLSQALCIFEEEIGDSRAQLSSISLIIGTLQQTRCFADENHEPLRAQCARAAQKLFKKPDKARALCLVAQLLWHAHIAGQENELNDGDGVLSCLTRSLKTAAQCMDPCVQVQLFTEILNYFVYFAEKGCQQITSNTINQLTSKIRETLPQLEGSPEMQSVKLHFDNTIEHLRFHKENTIADDKFSYRELIL